MSRKNPKNRKVIFIENCGIFKNDIMVCVGTSYKDIFRYVQKKKLCKYVVADLKDRKELIDDLIAKQIGFVLTFKPADNSYLLWLKEYHWKKWADIECLLHELHHLVDFVARQKGFEDEIEAKTFLFEDLFSKIRRKLFNTGGTYKEEIMNLRPLSEKEVETTLMLVPYKHPVYIDREFIQDASRAITTHFSKQIKYPEKKEHDKECGIYDTYYANNYYGVCSCGAEDFNQAISEMKRLNGEGGV